MPGQPEDNILGMSDEDFGKLNSPPASAGEVTPNAEEVEAKRLVDEQQAQADQQKLDDEAAQVLADQATADAAKLEQDKLDEQAALELANKNIDDDATLTDDQKAAKKLENVQKVDDKSKDSANLSKDKSGVDKTQADKVETPAPKNFEELYNKIMAPLKANGKTIELQSPEEAIQLMQMGANYTKKMQAIQPHRKILQMLENNGLLDDGKLSYLIDLDKKNPEAIKKLIKDSGIDPLQIDTEAESTYIQGNHRVSDEEAGFVSQLDDLKSTQEGTKTLQAINTWDQASKEVLWKNPELMGTIHIQRENGIYDVINNEVERRRVLGSIPTHVSFLNAYKLVGDELDAKGAFAHLVQKQQVPGEKVPVATRVAQPKPVVKNGDKASAAAPTRSSPKVTKPFVNPLSMSDEQFMKEFKDRL